MAPELNETPAHASDAGQCQYAPPRKPIQQIPLTELQKQKVADLYWAAASSEVQQHVGKYVIIHKKKIVGVGDDCEKLLEQAAEQEQCPSWHLVVEIVPNWLDDDFSCDLDMSFRVEK